MYGTDGGVNILKRGTSFSSWWLQWMLILNCPHPGQKGTFKHCHEYREKFVNMKISPAGTHSICSANLANPERPATWNYLRETGNRSTKALRFKNRESGNKGLDATFTTTDSMQRMTHHYISCIKYNLNVKRAEDSLIMWEQDAKCVKHLNLYYTKKSEK